MPDDDPKKLGEEIRQEEHLRRVRDYGAADAATYPDRVAEGAAMLARDAAATQDERIPDEAKLDTLVSRAEPAWRDDRPIRPLTQELIDCCKLDVWPGMATIEDFGIDSSSHLGALQYALILKTATPQELDAAMGNGPALTEIASRGDNPYRFVTFKTAYDNLPVEPDFYDLDDVLQIPGRTPSAVVEHPPVAGERQSSPAPPEPDSPSQGRRKGR